MGEPPFRVGDTVEHIWSGRRIVVRDIWPHPGRPGEWLFDALRQRGMRCEFWRLVPTPDEDAREVAL